jgi:hypothetical protein
MPMARPSILSASVQVHFAIIKDFTGAYENPINSDHFSGNISSILV